MSFSLSDLDTRQLLALSNALALALSKGLTTEEIGILASVITATGDLMAIIADGQERLENN